MPIPVLETARLRLRPARRTDYAPHVAMWADPRTTAFIGGTPRAPDDSWRRLLGGMGMWEVLGYGYWIFADRDSDALIGTGGLAWFARGVPELEGVPEAGWALSPDHWGKGLATEAMAAVFRWADAHLSDPVSRCIIDPDNAESAHVAAKLGFARIGHNRDAIGPIDIWERPRGAQPDPNRAVTS